MVELVDLRGQGIMRLFEPLEACVRVVRDPRDASLGAARGIEEFLKFFHVLMVMRLGTFGLAVNVVDSEGGGTRCQGTLDRRGRRPGASARWRLT